MLTVFVISIGALVLVLLYCLARYLISIFLGWVDDRRETWEERKDAKKLMKERRAVKILEEAKKILEDDNPNSNNSTPQIVNGDDLDRYVGYLSDNIEDAYTEVQKDAAWDGFCQGYCAPIDDVYRTGRIPALKVRQIFMYMNNNNLRLNDVCAILSAYSWTTGVREVIKDLYFLFDYPTDEEINNAPSLYKCTIDGKQSYRVFEVWKQTKILWKDVVKIIEIGWGALASQNLDDKVNDYFRKGA